MFIKIIDNLYGCDHVLCSILTINEYNFYSITEHNHLMYKIISKILKHETKSMFKPWFIPREFVKQYQMHSSLVIACIVKFPFFICNNGIKFEEKQNKKKSAAISINIIIYFTFCSSSGFKLHKMNNDCTESIYV